MTSQRVYRAGLLVLALVDVITEQGFSMVLQRVFVARDKDPPPSLPDPRLPEFRKGHLNIEKI